MLEYPMKNDASRSRMLKTAALIATSAVFALLLSACEENPVDKYGTGLIDAYKRAEPAANAASLSLLQQSIKTYRSAHGRYPKDLKELEALTGTKIDPGTYSYDPSTGTLALKPQ